MKIKTRCIIHSGALGMLKTNKQTKLGEEFLVLNSAVLPNSLGKTKGLLPCDIS